MKKTFIQQHKDSIDNGFLEEHYRSTIINLLESQYKIEILREWGIVDFIPNGDKVIVKWFKRIVELDNEQLLKKYGRTKD